MNKVSTLDYEFRNGRLVKVENERLEYLVGHAGLSTYQVEETKNGAIGHWSFISNELGLKFNLLNYSDRFVMYITDSVGSKEYALEYLSYFDQFVNYRKYQKATSTEPVILPFNEAYVGVKVTFMYDGEILGKEFIKAFYAFKNYGKYINEVY